MKILVLQLNGIGDLVLTLPFLHGLRRRYPHSRITLMAAHWAKDLGLIEAGAIDDLIICDVPWVVHQYINPWSFVRSLFSIQSVSAIFDAAKKLRPCRFDLSVEMRGDVRHALILYFAEIRQRVGQPFRFAHFFLTQSVKYSIPPNDWHQNKVNQMLATTMGFEIVDNFPRLKLPGVGSEADSANSVMRLMVHMGASKSLKQWPFEKWIELIKKATVFTPIEIDICSSDQAAVELALAEVPRKDISIRVHYLPLKDFIAAIGCSHLFIGADSGPAHVAAALGVPVIVLFGPTRPSQWAPIGLQVTSLAVPDESVPCRPCRQKVCIHPQYHHCMQMISVEEVFDCVHTQISKLKNDLDEA